MQFVELHVGFTPVHTCPLPQVLFEAWQLVQAAPPVPQNESRLPGRQSRPSQQPVGHVFASHTGGGGLKQAPAGPPSNPPHASPSDVQSTQSCPPTPQAALSNPGRQVLPAQQPKEHVCALHTGGWGVQKPNPASAPEQNSPNWVQSVHC